MFDPEMEFQQSYSGNGFSSYYTDSGFSVEANSDADFYYSEHTENLYDEARYNHLPSGPTSSEFDEHAEIDLRFGLMQDKSMNDYTSPQLVCPTPTLPSSQVAPRFSWSEWSSEAQAPVNVHQTYLEPSTQRLLPHSTAEIQYPFETQVTTPSFYPANVTSTSRPHGDIGYAQQLSIVSPQQSVHSAVNQPRHYTAHQPVPPEQRSSYSELALNLNFLNSQTQHAPTVRGTQPNHRHHTPKRTNDDTTGRSKTPSLDPKKNPYALGLNGPPLTAIGRKISTPPLVVASDRPVVKTTTTTATTTAPSTIKTKSSRSVNEPRRPSLACIFCRERKIACGRPPEGSVDLTCNQCARRSFRCLYADSKSKSPIRSLASSKTSSSSRKRK